MTTESTKFGSTTFRSLLIRVIAFTAGVIGCLLALELIFHFLPVASGLRTQIVSEDNPVLRFEPNRDFLWSRDWNFSIVNYGHVNNVGFVNDYDYQTGDSTLLAVIGDSYIEAAMVPFPQTLHGRLRATVGTLGRVYSFGMAGAPLSQYLAWAAYVRGRYDPTGLVINVVGNDFDESLLKYKPVRGLASYAPNDDGVLTLQSTEGDRRTWFREIASYSALARYLFFNVSITQVIRNFRTQMGSTPSEIGPRYFGNTDADASEERILDSKLVVLAFFRDLPLYAGLPSNRILFVVDGMRDASYDPNLLAAAEQSYFGQMRRFFINTAHEKGYEVADLHRLFVERYERDNVRFEFPTDGHWNAIGHEVAAHAIERSKLFRDLFERESHGNDSR